MTDVQEDLKQLKKEEDAIREIQDAINSLKSRGLHTYYAMNMYLSDGVAKKVETYFKERAYHYVKVESCGCARKTYDIMIQFL